MAKEIKQSTRGGMHRVERAERQQRWLIISAVAVISLVIMLVVGGTVFEAYWRPTQPIATVRDEIITIAEFEARVRYERVQWLYRYDQARQTLELVGDNPEFASQVQQQMQQILGVLDPIPFAEGILDQLIAERLIRQEAHQRDIFVSEEDINQEILERYSFFPNGTPTINPTETLWATSTFSSTQLAIMTATSTATITQTMAPMVEVTSGIFTTTPTEIEGVTTTLEATATGGIATLTPTVITTQMVGERMVAELGVFADLSFFEDDLRKLHEFELYRQLLFEAITEATEREQEQVWIRHIKVENEETALDVLDRLEKGEDWVDVVEQLSINQTSKLQGGDLGWWANYPQDPDYPQDFMDIAFSMEIGDTSQPIETTVGWQIIQILGKEVRQLSLVDFTQINQNIFIEFIKNLRESSEITIIPNWRLRVPDQPSIPIDPLNQGFPPP